MVDSRLARLHTRHATFVKFASVGASGVIVNLGIFTILLELGMTKYIGSALAIEISILWNFWFNNIWTFRSRRLGDRLYLRGVKFNFVSVVALGVSYSTFVLLSLLFPETLPQAHQLLAIVPATAVNYLLNSRWTFRSVVAPPGQDRP